MKVSVSSSRKKGGHSTSSPTDLGSIRNAKDQMGERKEEEK
jgi:hypothetical protein